MYIEITPTTQLPAFEAYLDGNGGTESADGNDNGINSATQFDYLDGNLQANNEPAPQDWTITSADVAIDTSSPTELTYNFSKVNSILCGSYIDSVLQTTRAYFDGNSRLHNNTIFLWTEGEGNIDITDGNAPSQSVPLMIDGVDLGLAVTGDLMNSKYLFMLEQMAIAVGNGDTTNYTYHFGPTTYKNPTKQLSGNIAFVEEDFDYTIDTTAQIQKRGALYPGTVKLYTDITGYNVLESLDLVAVKGSEAIRYNATTYGDTHGPIVPGLGTRMLIVQAQYADSSNTIYDANGVVIGDTRAYTTIAVDTNYTGTAYYLYDITTSTGYPETDGITVTIVGHQEYKLKGVVMYNGSPHWCIMQYISYQKYGVLELDLITEDLATVRNKEIAVVVAFNKELTT